MYSLRIWMCVCFFSLRTYTQSHTERVSEHCLLPKIHEIWIWAPLDLHQTCSAVQSKCMKSIYWYETNHLELNVMQEWKCVYTEHLKARGKIECSHWAQFWIRREFPFDLIGSTLDGHHDWASIYSHFSKINAHVWPCLRWSYCEWNIHTSIRYHVWTIHILMRCHVHAYTVLGTIWTFILLWLQITLWQIRVQTAHWTSDFLNLSNHN